MTATSAVIPFPGYEPPAEANSFLISRAAEAEAICAHVMQANNHLVVLCGQAASGKTLLLRRWVIPALKAKVKPRGIGVYTSACAPTLPAHVSSDDGEEPLGDVLSRGGIVVIDDFDHLLDLPREARRTQIDAFFETLGRAHRDTIVVVVVSLRHLTSIYALSSYDPHIASAVYQVKSVGIDEGLRELSSEHPETSASYSPELLVVLGVDAKEFERRGIDVSFELLRVLHARFARYRKETGVQTVEVPAYRKLMGGLPGILRDHVNRTLEELSGGLTVRHQAARAVLQRTVEAEYRLEHADTDEIAARYERPIEDLRTLLDGMTQPSQRALLRKTPDDVYELLPPHIVLVIEEDIAARQLQNERALRIVDEGLRSWEAIRALLPPERFSDVHRQRRHLVLDEEMTRFLAKCALKAGAEGTVEAAKYWVSRLRSREDRIDLMLFAAMESDASVRKRAVILLGEFADGLVRERLTVLALTDPADDVRQAAIASLETMADTPLLERLFQEIQTVDSACRANAVDALRIFRRPDVTPVLRSIVDDAKASETLRARAVRSLAALDIPESVDALVTIALDDPDVEDREASADALASARSVELNLRILDRLDWRRPTVRIAAALIVLGGALLAGAYGFYFNFYGSLEVGAVDSLAFVAVFLGLTVLLVPLGMLLARFKDGRLARRSSAGILAQVVFWASAVVVMPLLHGLAHALIGRWKRAFALLLYEALGVFAYVVVADMTEFLLWGRLADTYRLIGGALFVGSYLYDVLGVALALFLFQGAQKTERRRTTIYRAAFRNPAMADAVFGDLKSSMTSHVRRTRKLLRHYGSCIAPTKLLEMFAAPDPVYNRYVIRALTQAKDDEVVARLEESWKQAQAGENQERQRAIAAILAGRPTARSTDALDRMAPWLRGWSKARARLARLHFKIAVWSWPERLVMANLGIFAVVLLYHAYEVRSNEAWLQLMQLRQPHTESAQQVKIVNFLADAYPRESADGLRELFHERMPATGKEVTPAFAAIARGLVTIHDSLPHDAASFVQRNHIRDDLFGLVGRFYDLLSDSNPERYTLGLGVLTKMANAEDNELSTRGIATLVAFAYAGRMSPNRGRVVIALAAMPYERSIPALDRVIRNRQSNRVLSQSDDSLHVIDFLKDQIDSIATRAYGPMEKGSTQSAELLAMLRGLKLPPKGLIARISRDQERVTARGDVLPCDRNRDGTCDALDETLAGREEALATIADSPDAEEGYLHLYSHYKEDEKDSAAAAFTRLAKVHPRSIWPRKFASLINHEYVSKNDPRAFQRSYDDMLLVRGMPVFRQLREARSYDYVRIESDFAEIALSARRFDETKQIARDLLSDQKGGTTRYNMSLFVYFASVMQRDAEAASADLSALATVIDSLPADFFNNWIYPGTVIFIERSDLPAEVKDALRALCKEGDWYGRKQAQTIVEQNRAALRLLTKQGAR
jgi:HEAT repeat protein